ncbi:MAG: thioredoxin-disulfide reductase [Chloroflexi bacterium]|nr:thioredoxin-disulfide reductase [Chloroflexota bacterium]
MEPNSHHQLVIIGGGPAGFAAALYGARADLKPVIFSGMLLYGQASQTDMIENYPGFPEGIQGIELGKLFEQQAARFGALIEYEQVLSLDFQVRPFVINTYSGSVSADAVILAMGADPNKLQVPGEVEFTGRGVSYCGTCDGFFTRNKDIHVIGGGDTALEEALFLTRFARSVTVVHRRDVLRAGAILEKRARSNPKISFLWNTVVDEIRGDEKVQSLLVHNVKTNEKSEIPTQAVFIFVGHSPNVSLIKGQIALDKHGYVKIDDKMATNIPGVFAAGEIADPHYRQVITSAGMGAAAAISATQYLGSLES